MSTPLFFPIVQYVPRLELRNSLSIRELCSNAGVACRASGVWTERKVEVICGMRAQVLAEPGDWGSVKITIASKPGASFPAVARSWSLGMPVSRTEREQARYALAVLAFSLHDLVAKESIKGQPWLQVSPPKGRPRTGKALTTRERQIRYRIAHSQQSRIISTRGY